MCIMVIGSGETVNLHHSSSFNGSHGFLLVVVVVLFVVVVASRQLQNCKHGKR